MLTLEVERVLRGYHVHSVDTDAIWASRGGTVYVGSSDGSEMTPLDRVCGVVEDQLAVSTLLRRLLRLGIHKLIRLQTGTLLAVSRGRVFRWADSESGFSMVHSLRFGRRPLHLAEDPQGNVYYGEYWTNEARQNVRLVKGTDDGREWEPVYTFASGTVRHIHAVHDDPFGDRLWIATGDRDHECAIGYSIDQGQSFHFIGAGSQQWRAVSLLFTADAVYWGTDDPNGRNVICRWDRATGSLDSLAEVIGPVYYGKRVGEWLLFATTVERGEGDQDGWARIYAIDPHGQVTEVYATRKDPWHPILFGYGTIEFPHGQLTDDIRAWATVSGLGESLSSILFRIKRASS